MSGADYHLHTDLSADSDASMDAVCRQAVTRGLREICFTEHYDVDPYDRGYNYYDDQRYERRLAEVRAAWGDRLIIRKGLEFDFQSRHADRLAERLAPYRFDFLIGSVHCVFGSMVSQAITGRGFPPEEVYREYFAELRALVATGLPNVLGHLDYVRKVTAAALAGFRYADFDRDVADLAARLVDAGIGLEVNTRHVDRGQPIVPGVDVLRAYHDAGGRIVTLGSDAHTPDGVGQAFDRAAAMLREAGFTQVMTFVNRRGVAHRL